MRTTSRPQPMTQRHRNILGVVASLALLAGCLIGMTGAKVNAQAAATEVPHRSEIWNARQYAAWCGGYVQVINGDVTVEGCQR